MHNDTGNKNNREVINYLIFLYLDNVYFSGLAARQPA